MEFTSSGKGATHGAGFLTPWRVQTLLMLLWLVAAVSQAEAQVTAGVGPGDWVRIRTVDAGDPKRPVERSTLGWVQSITADSVVVRTVGGPAAFDLRRVHRFEVSRGTRTQLGDGLLAGAILGGTAAVAGVWVYEGVSACLRSLFAPDCDDRRPRRYERIGLIGMLAGGLVGGWIGANSIAERWENVSATIGPSRAGGFGVSVSVSH